VPWIDAEAHVTAYRWDAAEYSRSSSQQKKWGRELIAKLDLSGGERVLDIGCGDGLLSVDIASMVPGGSVVGLDSSLEMIRHAVESFPPGEYPNVYWRCLDARELDYESEFDVAFSNAALHWIKDHGPVLAGVARSLVPGGRVLFQMGGSGNFAGIVSALGCVLSRQEWAGYFTGFSAPYGFYGPEEYTTWLEEAGLEPRRVDLVRKDMAQEGREGLAGWIRTTWLPFTERIPEHRREEFVYAFADAFLEAHPPDGLGLVHAESVRLEVEASKPVEAGRGRPSVEVGG